MSKHHITAGLWREHAEHTEHAEHEASPAPAAPKPCNHGSDYKRCSASQCTKCGKKFGWLKPSSRRGHCRQCHKAVCYNCLAIKVGYKTCVLCQESLLKRRQLEIAAEMRRMERAPLVTPEMVAAAQREQELEALCARMQQKDAAREKAMAKSAAAIRKRDKEIAAAQVAACEKAAAKLAELEERFRNLRDPRK